MFISSPDPWVCVMVLFVCFFTRNALLVNNMSFVISESHALQAICSLSFQFSSFQSLSHVRLFATPMNCSTPGLPVHQQLPEFTETHVHRVSDAIQPSHSLSSPFPPAPNPSLSNESTIHMRWKVLQSTGVSALASFLPKKSQG